MWSYQTSVRLSIRVMPFTLVYGVEVMLPIEIELPALCLVAATQLDLIINDYATVCIMALEHLEKC